MTDLAPADKIQADVLITNGGYGTQQLAMMTGVPMISCQTTEDKQTIGTIMEHAGGTIYHRIEKFTPELVKTSFEQLLENPRYKEKALSFAREYQKYDTLELVHEGIMQSLRDQVKDAPLEKKAMLNGMKVEEKVEVNGSH